MSQVPVSGAASERSSGVAQEPRDLARDSLRVAFFGHDWTESTIIKRVEAFQEHGAKVTGFMFRRLHDKIALAPSWTNVALGATRDGRYLRRIGQLFAALPTVIRNRELLRDADVIYARNTDMLACAVLGRLLTGSKAPLVYEALDVQPIYTGTGTVSRIMRFLERRLMSASSLLVVSSPTFVSRYFEPVQRYSGPWFLLENKVVMKPAPGGLTLPVRTGPRRRGRWTIGWFGVIRCQRSLAILERVAARLGDRVEIHIRGLPSVTHGITAERLQRVANRRSNIKYFGPYNAPRDLASIYGAVDLVWAVDFSAAGSNSDWLIPNRLYEGGLYGVPALARKDTATGDIVARDESGWCLDEPLEASLTALIEDLDEGTYDVASCRLRDADRSTFVDIFDTRDLVSRLRQISSLAGDTREHNKS